MSENSPPPKPFTPEDLQPPVTFEIKLDLKHGNGIPLETVTAMGTHSRDTGLTITNLNARSVLGPEREGELARKGIEVITSQGRNFKSALERQPAGQASEQ